MGCGVIRNQTERSILFQITRKFNPGVVRSDTQISSHTNNASISRGNSGPHKCLKIKILPEDRSVSAYTINLSCTQLYMASLEYIPDYNYIKEIYTEFSNTLRHFANLVHDACLNDFVLTEGIFIFLVSIGANKGVAVKYLSSSPFLEVKGELSEDTKFMLQEWNCLCGVIENVLKKDAQKLKKSIQRLENFSGILQQKLELVRNTKIEKNLTICKIAVKTGEELLAEVASNKALIEKFFISIDIHKKDIKKYGKLAQKSGICTGERIVHTLLCV